VPSEANAGSPNRAAHSLLGDHAAAQESKPLIRRQDGQDQHQAGGRENAPGAPGVEARHRNGAGGGLFADQQAGDEEPGKHKEHIDADVSAFHPRDARVRQHNEPHGHRPQPFDVGPELPFAGGH